MKYLKHAILILSLGIVVTGMIYLIFFFYNQFRQPAESPYKAIPEKTSFVIKLNRPGTLWEEITRSNLIWNNLTGIPGIKTLNDQLLFLDSILKNNEKVSGMILANPLIIALSLTGRTTHGWLILSSVRGSGTESLIRDFLEQTFNDRITIITTPYSSTTLFQVIFPAEKKTVYMAVYKGVFIFTYQPTLAKKALDQLALNLPSLYTKDFQRIESTTGKNVDANMYLHYPFMESFLSKLLKDYPGNDSYKFSKFAEWSGLDIHIKNDELLANGYTTYNDSSNHYLRIFAHQTPQKISLSSVIPDNIYYFTWMGTNDIQQYYQYLLEHARKDNTYRISTEQLEALRDLYQGDFSEYFLPWSGNELALVVSPGGNLDAARECYALVRLSDIRSADSLLKKLAKVTGKKADSTVYNEQTIFRIELEGIIPGIYGSMFQQVSGCCYTFINGYVVFGNTISSMKNYIGKIQNGMVIGNDRKYLDHAEGLSEEANLFFYFNTSRGVSDFKSFLSEELNSALEPLTDTLRKCESFSVQITNRGGIFYTHLLLHYNPDLSKDGPLHWQAVLDTAIYRQPKIVKAVRLGNSAVLVSDVSNTLYMIDTSGNICWKVRLPGKSVGDIHEIFMENADSSSFFLATENHICLVHGNGTSGKDFPLNLPYKAIGGLVICNFKDSKESVILIPLSDKKIHAYSLTGRPLKKWYYPSPGEEIRKSPQHLKVQNKDFIIITGKSGKILITDSRGKSLIRTGKSLLVSANNVFYLNRTNKKGIFLSTDIEGKVNYIRENGKLSEATFNFFTPSHTFIYTDIDNDGSSEFIFFDLNKIYYYNRFYKLIYSYSLTREIRMPPFLIERPDGEKLIGLFSESTKEVYLFGKKGLWETDPVIRGTTPFDVGALTRERGLELVIGSGRYLKSYRLSKE